MGDLRYRVLAWDSQWFGFPIGRVDLFKFTASSVLEIDMWAQKQGLKCVYVFVEGDEVQAKEDSAGFVPIDTRVEYEINPNIAKGPMDTEYFMRPEEQESVCALARRVFTRTRFLRDPEFPQARARELYAEWVRRDTKGCFPGCLVIRDEGDIIGFVTGRVFTADATRGSIGLLGVDDAYQGHGFGSNLLDHVCRAFVKIGVQQVTVVTQESNVAACGFYQRHGKVVARGRWYHRWYNNNLS